MVSTLNGILRGRGDMKNFLLRAEAGLETEHVAPILIYSPLLEERFLLTVGNPLAHMEAAWK